MATAASRTARSPRQGIGYWMECVLAERKKVEEGFAADPVHDFRVALRRCRSIADGFRELDPDSAWKKMRAEGKSVFAAFGELRDVQVLQEWTEKLKGDGPEISARLQSYCSAREGELKIKAAVALGSFNERAWLRWAELLQRRAEKFAPGDEIFQVLALQKWEAARALHGRALRNRSKAGFHQLRIGIKRFRYLVENFLPVHHELWSKDLKRLQDLLGEIHDLDVLWEITCAQVMSPTIEERQRWQEAIQRERNLRLEAYRGRMLGRRSLWQEWRSSLPSGDVLRRAILKRFAGWAALRDVDKVHTGRVRKFSLAIYDAMGAAGLLTCEELDGVACRDLLAIAASVHEAGRGKGGDDHHKRTRRMVERLVPPPGWTRIHLQAVALVARYHRGALPTDAHRRYRSIPQMARRAVDELAAILRLADAFDSQHDHSVTRLKVAKQGNVIAIHATGYGKRTKLAERVAGARHLLESVTGLPVFVTAA